MTWAERIPAAIEKAEGLLGGDSCEVYKGVGLHHIEDYREFMISNGEVALAKALWNLEETYGFMLDDLIVEEERGLPDPALRAFVEKVEAL